MIKKLKPWSEMSDKEKEEIMERCLPDEETKFKELAKVMTKIFKREIDDWTKNRYKH